jgi:hypothetical protein
VDGWNDFQANEQCTYPSAFARRGAKLCERSSVFGKTNEERDGRRFPKDVQQKRRRSFDTSRFVYDAMAAVLFVVMTATFRSGAPLLARITPTKAMP